MIDSSLNFDRDREGILDIIGDGLERIQRQKDEEEGKEYIGFSPFVESLADSAIKQIYQAINEVWDYSLDRKRVLGLNLSDARKEAPVTHKLEIDFTDSAQVIFLMNSLSILEHLRSIPRGNFRILPFLEFVCGAKEE